MKHNMLKNIKSYQAIAATAAGTDDTITGTAVAVGTAKGACCTLNLGAITDTAVLTIKAYGGTSSAQTDLIGQVSRTCGASDTDDKQMVLDVSEVRQAYIRFDVVRADANAVVNGGTVTLYNLGDMPAAIVDGDVVAGAIVQDDCSS